MSIVLIHSGLKISDHTLTLLRKKGLVPIRCDDPSMVKVVDTLPEIPSSLLLAAAVKAIKDHTYSGIREEFAKNVLAALTKINEGASK